VALDVVGVKEGELMDIFKRFRLNVQYWLMAAGEDIGRSRICSQLLPFKRVEKKAIMFGRRGDRVMDRVLILRKDGHVHMNHAQIGQRWLNFLKLDHGGIYCGPSWASSQHLFDFQSLSNARWIR
jgi:hypothetical protein